MFAAGARAGAAEPVPSLGEDVVDDLESADVGVEAPADEESADDEEPGSFEPPSFEDGAFEPDFP